MESLSRATSTWRPRSLARTNVETPIAGPRAEWSCGVRRRAPMATVLRFSPSSSSCSVLAVARDEALRQLLLARPGRGIQPFLSGQIRQAGEIELAAGDPLAQLPAPARITLLLELFQGAVGHDIRSRQQRARERVDAADVSQVQVGWIDRLPPQLGIEVESARGEAFVLHHLHHRWHQLLRIVGKLIRIPTIARIAAIDVD